MKRLPVDLEEIATFMENVDRLNEYYLDTHTGATVILPPELVDLAGRSGDDLPDWEKDLIPIAVEIDEGSDRYVPIPEFESYEGYDLMVEFAQSVSEPGLRDRLAIALDGKGAFRRFKNVLRSYPDEQKRWFAFNDAAMTKRAREWLHELGIEPVERPARPGQR